MKKLYALLFLLAVVQVSRAQYAENTEPYIPSNTIFLKPLDFFVGGFSMGYQRIFNNTSIQFESGYFFNEDPGFYDQTKNLEGFRTEAIYKLFYKSIHDDEVYFRPYFAGYALYKYASQDYLDNESNQFQPFVESYKNAQTSTLGFGIYLGAQGFIDNGFTFDLYIGGGVYTPLTGSEKELDVNHLDLTNPYKKSIAPRAGFSLGYSF